MSAPVQPDPIDRPWTFALLAIGLVSVLAGCGSAAPPKAKHDKPPGWAQYIGVSSGDPRSSSGSEREMSYHSGDDDDDVEPIDFPSCEQAQEEHALAASGMV